MKKARVAILASGRGSNAVALIEASLKKNYPAEIVLVVSDNSDAPVLEKARALGVKALYLDPGSKRTFLTPEVETEWIRVLQEHEIDYVILAGFMRVLKNAFLRAFSGRILNVHPALLPSFKGLDAQRQAFEYGVKYSGATVHFVDDSLDGGAIILQEPVRVADDDTPDTLSDRILEVEHRIYPEALRLVAGGLVKITGRRVKILKETHG